MIKNQPIKFLIFSLEISPAGPDQCITKLWYWYYHKKSPKKITFFLSATHQLVLIIAQQRLQFADPRLQCRSLWVGPGQRGLVQQLVGQAGQSPFGPWCGPGCCWCFVLRTEQNIRLKMGRSIGIGKYRLKFMVSGSDRYYSTDT